MRGVDHVSNVELKRQWEVRIANFKESGLSVKDWCSQKGLKANQLRYWLKKNDNDTEALAEKPHWIPVTVNQLCGEENKTALPIKIGKAVIEVSPGYDPELLSDVVRTLIAL